MRPFGLFHQAIVPSPFVMVDQPAEAIAVGIIVSQAGTLVWTIEEAEAFAERLQTAIALARTPGGLPGDAA